MAENTNLFFIHQHPVLVSKAKKISNNCYEIDGNSEGKVNNNLKLSIFDIYISFYCLTCGDIVLKSSQEKDFKVSSKKKVLGLRNSFNEKKKLENVYFEDNPNLNLINNPEYENRVFYKFDELPPYDNNTIYVGTKEEQIEFFHKKFKDFERSYNEITNKGIIFLKGNDNEDKNCKKTYHIIIRANSILALNQLGWEIKYPRGKEEYEKLIKKPMIIVGVVGNRNKGKSFILGKLSNYPVPEGFNIKTEGISVRFGEKEDHCIAILDSAGQEVPLLTRVINQQEAINEEENIQINEIKEDNDKENKNGEKAPNKISLLEKSLRDKLITEKFLEEFIIHTSDILILVVGNITLSEQRILTRIKNSLKNGKYLYVIHNLQNYRFKADVEDYIENTLKKLYGIEIIEINFQNNNEKYHSKYYIEKDSNISHLIFINDYSTDSDYYNVPAIDFLKKNIDVVKTRTKFSVIEECENFLTKIQTDFLEENISKNDFVKADNKIKVNKKEIKLKKIFTDEIGKTIANDTDIPNYYYYTEKNDLIINVELPGPNPSITSAILKDDEFYNFSFKGEKSGNTSDSKEKHLLSKNLKDKTPFKFSILIPKKEITILPNDKGKIQFYEKSEKNEQGLFTFKYHIAVMEEDNEYE